MTAATSVLPAALALALLASVPPAATAGPPYDGQRRHGSALFGVRAPDHAAAQEFRTAGGPVTRVGVYLGSRAATGRMRVEIRRTRADASSAVAATGVDLAALGGAGAGWVEFPLHAVLARGRTYYLHLQAVTGAPGPVAWYGTPGTVPGSLTSWNYDEPYWGGWHPYTSRLAFHVNPAGDERCGETEPCYVPTTALAARTAGLLANGTAVEAVAPSFAVGAAYVDGSNVLRLPSGRWRHLPAGAAASSVVPADDAGARAGIAESRHWLAAGGVPGRTAEQRAAVRRALLSMRALLRPNGAFAAAWSPAWAYSWPRDGAFAAAAFAATGHDAEAYRILRYDARTQRADGTWAARTRLDGSGPPDGRTWQLDANGWVPWATWQWYRYAAPAARDDRLRELYPMVRAAADRTARTLGSDGLPPASPDYWELDTEAPTVGTAAPLLAGLNAAADLAARLGRDADADRWAGAARRLSQGVARSFAPRGYPRTADGRHGRDSAAAFMAPPFNAAPAGLRAALDSTYRALLLPNGGLSPGDDPRHDWGPYAWTASTSFFAVAWAHLGDGAKADRVLRWVLSHRNGLGELPETVNGSGRPSSVAPLGWTDALVVMAACAREGRPLPTPPARRSA